MADVTESFDQPGSAFVLLPDGVKTPPIEKEWQKKPHTFQEATEHKGNIGVIAGNGYIGLDQDEPEAFKELELAATTTWETRPARSGMRFACDDCTPEVLAKYGFKSPDQSQIMLYYGNQTIDGCHPHVGEVKLQRSYQVIPPSWKTVDGQKVDYKMLDSSPPAKISLDWLLSNLLRLGIVFSEKPKAFRLEANIAKLEGGWKKAIDARRDKSTKASQFLSEAAMRAKPGHRNTTGFWLACQLRDLGLQPGDASEYMRKYAESLEDQESEPYTFEEAMGSLKQAYSAPARDPPTSEKAEPIIEEDEAPEHIKRAAANIMECGDVLKFLVRQAQKNHIGDTDVIKHLLASIACTNSLTSAGIQPELNGEKGHGKTDAVRAVFHLIPMKWKLAASISAKALYYHKSLPTGAIIFSDDVEWSTDLIATVKRSMGTFQEAQTHYSLDKNREPLPHIMPARLVWWLSSVESVGDDQLKDRQYSLDIDEGGDHTKEVSDYLRRFRAEKKIRFSVDKGIEVAREIVREIKEHEPFQVVIPCAVAADWKILNDHRTQNKFWDLVEAFAILRFKQRHIDDDGWLCATIEDFNEAKTIFMRRKANHRTHLTNAQAEVVKAICLLQSNESGATQATVARKVNRSQPAISKSLKAIMENTNYIISEPKDHGEIFYTATVSNLEIAYAEGDIVSLPEDYQEPNTP